MASQWGGVSWVHDPGSPVKFRSSQYKITDETSTKSATNLDLHVIHFNILFTFIFIIYLSYIIFICQKNTDCDLFLQYSMNYDFTPFFVTASFLGPFTLSTMVLLKSHFKISQYRKFLAANLGKCSSLIMRLFGKIFAS